MEARYSGGEEIRDLRPEDRPDVAALAALAFPVSQARFVLPGDAGGKLITVDGQVVAVSLLRIFRLPSGRRIGFIAWLMTHPQCRGRGLAMKLVEASTAHLRAQRCEAVVTDVEGYNTASANLFHRAGYQRQSTWRQFRLWNPLDAVWLWVRCGYAIDPGHFLWVADAPPGSASSWRSRMAATLLNTLLALFALSLGGGVFLAGELGPPSLTTAVAFLLGVSGLLGARELGMRLAAARHRQPLEYRAWSGGTGMSLLIGIGFGKTMPLPGNLYPPGDGWSTRDYRAVLGQGAIVSALLVASLILAGSWARGADGGGLVAELGLALMFVGKPLLVFDTLVAIAPFEGFNSRHLRDYNRAVWAGLSCLAVGLFLWA